MKLFYKIPAALLGVAATFALVQPQIAVGLDSEEVGEIAQEITVRIDGPNNGSGAIVDKEEDTYTVLTNCHVIETPGTYTIETHTGSRYRVDANKDMCQPGGVDLAVLRFTSTQSYRVADLGDSSELVVGRKVYASGWVNGSSNRQEREYRFREGSIVSTESNAGEGYTLVHTNITRPGMSGGPILDREGDVVGINGLVIRDPVVRASEFFGIAINTYKSGGSAVVSQLSDSSYSRNNWQLISSNTGCNYDNTAYHSPTNYFLADTFKNHSDRVNSVAISPDGQLLASGSDDDTIEIWNLSCDGRLVGTLTDHSDDVESVAISPDGQLLASGSDDKTIKLWNLGSGRLVHTFTGHSDQVESIAISPDGQFLASGSKDDTIKIWNLSSGMLVHTLTGHSDEVKSVAISPDGQLLASGSYDDTIKIWNLSSGRLVRTFTGHSDEVESVAISPDGQLLASGSRDKTIKIWNLSSGMLVRTFTGHSDEVKSVAISRDGQLFVSGSDDNTIEIWDLGSGRFVRTLIGHSDDVKSLAISPDGQTIASSSKDKTIIIWRALGR